MSVSVTELKVYVPAENFAESQQFYRDLGFELTEAWGGNFHCRLGNTVVRLQNYYVKAWAEKLMLHGPQESSQAIKQTSVDAMFHPEGSQDAIDALFP